MTRAAARHARSLLAEIRPDGSHPNRRLLAAVVLGAATLALWASSAGAAALGTFAGSLGTKLPAGAEAQVRAIDRASGLVADTATVARNGSFRLSMAAGVYLVVGTIVPDGGAIVQSKVGVSLKAGEKRLRSTLDRRKTRRKKARRPAALASAAYVQERGQVTPGRIAVQIYDITGTSKDPERNAVRPGINDLLLVDVLTFTEECGGVSVLEVDRLADVLKELEFQQSIYVDPSTRVTRNFILGDVEVRGRSADLPGGGSEVTLRVTDKRSGEELASLRQEVSDQRFFEDIEQLAKDLSRELCELSDVFEVTLDVQGTGRFATHEGSGTLHSTIRARRGEGGENAVWRGTATTTWQGLAFSSKTPGCTYGDPLPGELVWSVEIRRQGDDELSVTWTQDNTGVGSYPTATVFCTGDPPPPPVAGQPGPALLGAFPQTFVVPTRGGSAPVGNGVIDGGDGFFNTGTISVVPSGSARKR